jgi:DNA polymerase-3 subunit delta
MQVRIDQLDQHLRRGPLARCYVVSGDEPLLGLEAQDAIRTAARRQGFDEREVLHADARWDWSALTQAATGLSLFSQRRLLEIRLPSGKPGKAGSLALQTHAARADADTLTLVSLPRLDRATRASDWASALQAAGVWIEVSGVARERLPDWIAMRLGRQRQSAPPEALEFLADRVEGNLIAAHQEIGKLRLLHGEGALSLEQIRAATLDVARFDIAALPAAMVAGDRARIVRLIEGLRAEGEPLPLILWMVSEELRGLLRLKQNASAGRGAGNTARFVRLNTPAPVVERMLPRLSRSALALALRRCARLDRLSKGLSQRACDDDPWLELMDVVLGVHAAPASVTPSVPPSLAR